MYGSGAQIESLCIQLLGDLCYLDEQDDIAYWAERQRYGKYGIQGPFWEMFGRDGHYGPEVASVFAEYFHRLGFLQVERTLDAEAWNALTTAIRDRFGETDVRRSQIVAEFGEPSLVVDSRIVCYVPAASTGWAFVDCWTDRVSIYSPGKGSFDVKVEHDPLVREFRLPAEDFESGLHLTLFGKTLRWGPGWWIHHPSANASEESLAIGAQLRQIEADDPSQPDRG